MEFHPGFDFARRKVVATCFQTLLPVSEADVAGDLVQATERARESAEFGGIMSSVARRAFSEGGKKKLGDVLSPERGRCSGCQ
jgi:hypothetical protein